jgi:AraC-type DNA-binding domain-containing proteins
MPISLDVFSDLSERVNYNIPNFPLYVRKATLKLFEKYTVANHWHPDLEFVLVVNGTMEYFVNGEIQRLKAGEGIFVNSKRMHYNYLQTQTDCSFIVVVIHPSLLSGNTDAGSNYVREKFGLETENFTHLLPEIEWQNHILCGLQDICNLMYEENADLLELLSKAAALCSGIGKHIQTYETHIKNGSEWPSLWNMTAFIHRNFDRKLTLEEIAAAGSVCRSKCCEIFRNHAGQTPNLYLTRYRIQKSSELLRDSDRSIIDIAFTCGFQSAGYFAQVFRGETGLTPKEYRAKSK